MADLSIIIVSYNTAEMTKRCLTTLLATISAQKSINFEVVVVDNASQDDTPKILESVKKEFRKKDISFTVVLDSQNLGYSKANNKGAAVARGKYLLFLNSDVLVEDVMFDSLLELMDKDSGIGVMTVRVVLPDGSLDPASHRGFPTLWRSFSYYVGLEKVLGRIPLLNKAFGGYHLTYKNLKKRHEIDSPTGAFYLTRKEIFDKVEGFDESFFMYGEDLDLSFRIKTLGYKAVYDPQYKVTHLKYQSGLKSKDSDIKSKTREYFYDAMRIFYDKHYAKKTPTFLNKVVHGVINQKAKSS